jgi:ElaB/YqjD/DUF883 family membrane-anchored ribosome-binding protein
MHKHNGNKHEEFKNFKMHHDAQQHEACCKARMTAKDPIKLLGTAALIGVLLGLLIR